MSANLQEELHQSRPFHSSSEEASLSIIRTASRMERVMLQKLRPYKLTPPQYNLLRILRGAGEKGLNCGQLSERMLTMEPDVTRLLDRLEKRGLLQRKRERHDRRIVTTRITDAGHRLIGPLDNLLESAHEEFFRQTSPEETLRLIQLLEHLRTMMDKHIEDAGQA